VEGTEGELPRRATPGTSMGEEAKRWANAEPRLDAGGGRAGGKTEREGSPELMVAVATGVGRSDTAAEVAEVVGADKEALALAFEDAAARGPVSMHNSDW
jgi:hypothetical protein